MTAMMMNDDNDDDEKVDEEIRRELTNLASPGKNGPPYGIRGCNAPQFICWFWALYESFACLINLVTYLLTLFFIYFLNHLLPYLYTSPRTD